MANNATGGDTAPYVGWGTWKAFIGDLHSKGTLPSKIDPSLMRSLSGSTQSQLRGALRFFRMIDENGTLQPRMRSLVAAYGTEQWPTELRAVVDEAYSALLVGVDLKAGTQAQLDEAFREHGDVRGDSLRKAVRFFFSAANEAKIPLSKYFDTGGIGNGASASGNSGDRPRRQSRPRKPRERASEPPSGPVAAAASVAPPGMREFDVPLPGRANAKVWVPEDVRKAEWEFMVSYISNWINLRDQTAE